MSNNHNVSWACVKEPVTVGVRRRVSVDAGGVMSTGRTPRDGYGRVAYYVDKILKGAKPADLPVQQATKFEFIINLKTAKQIGLTIPVRVLERANQLIK